MKAAKDQEAGQVENTYWSILVRKLHIRAIWEGNRIRLKTGLMKSAKTGLLTKQLSKLVLYPHSYSTVSKKKESNRYPDQNHPACNELKPAPQLST